MFSLRATIMLFSVWKQKEKLVLESTLGTPEGVINCYRWFEARRAVKILWTVLGGLYWELWAGHSTLRQISLSHRCKHLINVKTLGDFEGFEKRIK